jgi:hypothetical protein
MQSFHRRRFLSGLSWSLGALALPSRKIFSKTSMLPPAEGCWLSVCVPLVIEDPAGGVHSDLILTSASFDGLRGYDDKAYSTDYELSLFDFSGAARTLAGAGKQLRLSVPAMRTTVVKCSDLIRTDQPFWGGVRIRLLAKGNRPTHVADLFSAAYVRWNWRNSFDTLHAHPDPLQFQMPDRFFSSMPFPNLEEYCCTLSLFNPYDAPSTGRIIVNAYNGQKAIEQPYRLAPFASTLLNLNTARMTTELGSVFGQGSDSRKEISRGGSLVVENDGSTVKNFAYMIIKGRADNALAAEHTIHQGNYPIKQGYAPFGADESFKARGWLYSAFVFKCKKVAGLNLSSRVYLSAGRPLEDQMWLLPYATDAEGRVRWSSRQDDLRAMLPEGFASQGAIRLKPFQSCELDAEKLALPSDFAGGIGVAVSPQTSHVLMKLELRVHNWGTSAFTHFRPGARGARLLQAIEGRAGLASDYVVSGVYLKGEASRPQSDSLIGILNMEQDKVGEPTLEVFDSTGLVTSRRLGELPGYACKHFLLSELLPDLYLKGVGPLTLRLTDPNAVVILSALHIDYRRKDVAIDHGSDRFSTFLDYGCQ